MTIMEGEGFPNDMIDTALMLLMFRWILDIVDQTAIRKRRKANNLFQVY